MEQVVNMKTQERWAKTILENEGIKQTLDLLKWWSCVGRQIHPMDLVANNVKAFQTVLIEKLHPMLRSATLSDAERCMKNGLCSEKDLQFYLDIWNATICRFTFAYWQDGAIRQREKE